ncbi:MAG: ABC transporter permease, partial [Cypionkella sp.]
MATTKPFSRFEFMIAWRYLRAKRAEGGVSVMTWISLLGITLAVFALIATLAVRSGFRAEFVDTILGSNAHVTVYSAGHTNADGQPVKGFADFDAIAQKMAAIDGVKTAAPVVRGQVMVTSTQGTTGAEIYGMRIDDLKAIPRVGIGADAYGNIDDYATGVAIGSGIARELGVTVGDRIRVVAPSGVKTAFGSSPRVNAYTVAYVFTAGPDVDKTRIYMPFAEAQSFFNREGFADEIDVMVK